MYYNADMLSLGDLHREVATLGSLERAKGLARFFKTGKGDYGEGDLFAGLTVPQSRILALKYKDLSLLDIEKLLRSKIHEERLIALLLLVRNFKKGSKAERREIYRFYLSHTIYINNWDLVDLSSGYIIGGFLRDDRKNTERVLRKLALSHNLWERRIAIIATFAFIKHSEYEMTFQIADILLHDDHDLIQKAVGWMLREVGQRCSEEVEEEFLASRYKVMPRTMLRYAIERFSKEKRRAYLAGMI